MLHRSGTPLASQPHQSHAYLELLDVLGRGGEHAVLEAGHNLLDGLGVPVHVDVVVGPQAVEDRVGRRDHELPGLARRQATAVDEDGQVLGRRGTAYKPLGQPKVVHRAHPDGRHALDRGRVHRWPGHCCEGLLVRRWGRRFSEEARESSLSG